MIKSRSDRDRYIEQDMAAVLPHPIRVWRMWHRWQYPTVHFIRKLRNVEYLLNTRTGKFWKPFVFLARARVRAHGMKLGFTIPPNVFGPGLSIPHWGTIVVNDKARIGARCRIHIATNIGVKDGAAPVIGDDCYIGPGAKLFGGLTLGDRVMIGANAVVNRSFGNDVVLVGIPAKDVRVTSASDV